LGPAAGPFSRPDGRVAEKRNGLHTPRGVRSKPDAAKGLFRSVDIPALDAEGMVGGGVRDGDSHISSEDRFEDVTTDEGTPTLHEGGPFVR